MLLGALLGCSPHERHRSYAPAPRPPAAPVHVEDSLRILEYIESGRFAEAVRAIERLEAIAGADRGLPAVLEQWLERQRGGGEGGGHGAAAKEDPATPAAATTAAPEAQRLKDAGLDHYAAGRVGAAVECWRRALELAPADPEIARFLRRAAAVLQNCPETSPDGTPSAPEVTTPAPPP